MFCPPPRLPFAPRRHSLARGSRLSWVSQTCIAFDQLGTQLLFNDVILSYMETPAL